MVFSGNQEHATSPTEAAAGQSPKQGGIFHHRSSSTSSGGGLFHRRSSSLSSPEQDKSRRSPRRLSHNAGGFFGWHPHEDVQEDIPEDPKLIAAREKLARAERAEIRADREAVRAAGAVAEARQNVRMLEHETKR